MKIGMTRDVEASKTFAEKMVDAGLDAIKELGSKVAEVGNEIGDNETAPQIMARMALAFDKAHARWMTGAVEAAKNALVTRRTTVVGAPTPPVGKPSPIFYCSNSPTVAVSGTADYDRVAAKMTGTGFVPVKLVEGKGRARRELAAVHVYLNHIHGSPFGDYKEIFMMVSAAPGDDPPVINWADPENPAYVLLPMLDGATNFSLGLRVDAQNPGVVSFGKDVLGLDKQAEALRHFTVTAARVDIHSSVGNWDLHFRPKDVPADAANIFDAKGLVPSQYPPPVKGPQPIESKVVTRLAKGKPIKAWAWDLVTAAAPEQLPGINKFDDQKDTIATAGILSQLKFDPKMSTWAVIANGEIDAVTELPSP